MNTKQQRIAIATACGWKDQQRKWEGYHVWIHPDGKERYGQLMDSLACLPNYLSDLNAMHEAEKVLTNEKFEVYRWTLWGECKASDVPKWHRNYLSATAAQRAEAFLRTLSLWTGE